MNGTHASQLREDCCGVCFCVISGLFYFGRQKNTHFLLQNSSYFVLHNERTERGKMSEEVLTSVYVGLRGKFRRFASKFFPSEEDADDALQEAFCRLWPKRDSVNDPGEAEALVKTTVRNMGIDFYRRSLSVSTVALDEQHDVDVEDSDNDAAEREARFRYVERLVSTKLTAMQQLILHKHDYEGQGYDEIADSLSMNEAAVRMQLSRARKIIRECYRKSKNDEAEY